MDLIIPDRALPVIPSTTLARWLQRVDQGHGKVGLTISLLAQRIGNGESNEQTSKIRLGPIFKRDWCPTIHKTEDREPVQRVRRRQQSFPLQCRTPPKHTVCLFLRGISAVSTLPI